MPPNAAYLTDTDVITAVRVADHSAAPVLPGDGVVLHINAALENGEQVAQEKPAVCPASQDNLLWFRWHTPNVGGTLTMTASLTAGDTAPQDGWSDTLTWRIRVPAENTPPQTLLTDEKPAWFFVQPPGPSGWAPSVSWSDWVYDGGFVRRAYRATLDAGLTVSPTRDGDGANRIVTAERDGGGVWTMKSGYGISERVMSGVSLTSPTGSSIDGAAATDAQLAEGWYPEFNYRYAGFFRLFDRMGGGRFQLKRNPYSPYGFRAHDTPVWFPDGPYTAAVTVSQAWTPAGMLGRDAAGTIQIEGALPDDWYVRGY